MVPENTKINIINNIKTADNKISMEDAMQSIKQFYKI